MTARTRLARHIKVVPVANEVFGPAQGQHHPPRPAIDFDPSELAGVGDGSGLTEVCLTNLTFWLGTAVMLGLIIALLIGFAVACFRLQQHQQGDRLLPTTGSKTGYPGRFEASRPVWFQFK